MIAGSGAPDGRAFREKGGYRVSGCWHYASGAHYATSFTANCLVMDGGKLVLGSDGKSLIRAMAFEVPQVTILPAWDPVGMRGTGSDDFEVRDAFVPENRSFSLSDVPREPCLFAVTKMRQAIGELMALSGMTAIQPDSELSRAWRDYQVLAAHVSVSPRHLAAAGAQLLNTGA